MTETHPEDVDLFDYVEGDMPESRRAEFEAHLASCAPCAGQVARVRAGRDALRESQFLQLPAQRREGIFLNLPPQRREAAGRRFSLKQVLAVVTPAAAAAAVVVALVTTGGNAGGNENELSAGAGGTAEATASAPMSTDATGGGGEAQADRAAKSGSRLLVAGPADAVASELRRKGFTARVVGDHVEVRNAARQEVRRALRGRRDGSVRIIIVR